ncbi:hypothetical protein AXF42_Ash020875 [Apostasia shenzhenica]|uniref:NAB domain-containing protein n=1 Tax=Apostasia shenzhenica TaxID=1088818 RepID=A0A2H9ZRZ6_9ASPA|nr:hypothetical protein AXF42_Ash020875 [Apostasia shenzhenica]
MLQRAASNAYSWWWASSIRTKQSKWLDSNLHDMEDKVKTMIKLIEEDADSFAKKAEMYYRRRPELISYVEETYRAYKALADRYDRISGELHKANHTLASAFPDQVQFSMHDEDDDGSPKAFTAIDPSKMSQINYRNRGRDAHSALKKQQRKVSSHVTKENAQEEIDSLQKQILVLQTEREFVKSSYESGLAKFREIENQIAALQDEVCALQDEFSASSIIEDNEARALMAATALKSCEESLVSMLHQQRRSSKEARTESERIRESNNKLKALKGEETEEIFDENTSSKDEDQVYELTNEGMDLQSICEQVKNHFQTNSDTSVVDLAEKIDELVEKVISLEVIVSSQAALIQRLSSETDELHNHLRELEEDKSNLIIDTNSLNVRVKQAEDELRRIQDLEKNMHDEKGILHSHFADVCNSLNDISEKLQSPRCSSTVKMEKHKEAKEKGIHENRADADQEEFVQISRDSSIKTEKLKDDKAVDMVSELLEEVEHEDGDGIHDWQQQLLNKGPEGRQKMLLYEFSAIIRNYKETKKRLTEMEQKNQDYHFEMMAQIRELKSSNAIKDQEIRALRRKLFSHNISNNQEEESKQEKEGSIQVITAKSDASIEIIDTEDELKLFHLHLNHTSSPVEEKFRAELDTLLDENLDFWLRFSTSYHQIQRFDATFKDLQPKLVKLKDSNEGSSLPASPKETPPLDKKLRELHTELQVWLEQNGLLKGELQSRFAALCNIQEEISKALRDAGECEDAKFTPYQAAKFQGEVLNMQQENNKVAKELQTGLDHVKALQSKVARSLSKLRESFDLAGSNPNLQYQNFRHLSTRSKVPLRTFLFGEKKKKPSIFSCMSPAVHRQHNHIKSGFPT